MTTPTSLDQLADAVVAAGVQRIDGSVVGDGSRYDDEWFAPSWDNDVRGIEAGPYDALVVNDARVTGDPSRASDPAEGAAREFAALLAQRGVTVGGAPIAGVDAAGGDHDRVGLIGTDRRRGGRDARDERRQHGRDCSSRSSGWQVVAAGAAMPGWP